MSIIGALTEKPWLNPGLDAAALAHPEERTGGWDRGVGLGVFFVVVTMLFLLVTTAYLMRMGLHQGILGHAGSDWYRLGEPPLLWFNTGLLVVSSLAFHGAGAAARRDDGRNVRIFMIAGGLLGIAFLIGQLALWRHYHESGYAMAATIGYCVTGLTDPLALPVPQTRSGNPAIAFFYLITGLHGLHILGGLAAWGLTARRVFGGGAAAGAARTVQLCARYWHFMLLVWLIMLGLFVST